MNEQLIREGDQIGFADVNEEYAAFVEKFKPRKTTDDCYTPAGIYDAVAGWVTDEYGVDRSRFVRPFWPGANYRRVEYPEGCVVVDNPPFSLRSEIVAFYQEHKIKFFLFANGLTLLSDAGWARTCHVCVGYSITYENGAQINTSFETNLEGCIVRSAPELYRRLKDADENRKAGLPKYAYPAELITASDMARLSRYGVDYKIERGIHVGALDAQRPLKKTIFGSGILISEREAKEREAKEREAKEREAKEREIVLELSEREKRIISELA